MSTKLPTPARLEAFSDGVIAVIITIMVLELKVPRENGLAGLHAILPILLVYALSFAFTAIYWVNHHHLVDRVEHADHRIFYANLLFLFFLSLLPFFTSWTLEKKLDSFSIALYAVSLIATGFGFLVLRLAIDARLRCEGKGEAENRGETRKHLLSLFLYCVAIPLAYFQPRVALADLALVNLVWITPTAALKPHRNDRFAERSAGVSEGSTGFSERSAMDPSHPPSFHTGKPYPGSRNPDTRHPGSL